MTSPTLSRTLSLATALVALAVSGCVIDGGGDRSDRGYNGSYTMTDSAYSGGSGHGWYDHGAYSGH